jgi:hypothetical protein
MLFLASCEVITTVLRENASEKNFCVLKWVAHNSIVVKATFELLIFNFVFNTR